MTKYEVRFDSETQTYLVLELLWDGGEGSREWEIVGEYDTEDEAYSTLGALYLIQLYSDEALEIYQEFG